MGQPMKLCSVEGCDLKHYALGACDFHYQRIKRNGAPVLKSELPKPSRPLCSVAVCGRDSCTKGMCSTHYARSRRGSELDTPVRQRARNGDGCIVPDGYKKVAGRFEHRTIMEGILGRPLLPTETVHHLNGQRADNRPENLELWSSSQPPGQRVADKVAWAKEILSLYEEVH